MDSIPQELIDKIIDNVPQSSLPSCALVARRWRRESQQRALDTILFSSEDEVNRWCTDVPRDSDGISSYVRHVGVEVVSWTEPALLSRMLGSLSSLTALSMYKSEIPDELPGRISRGEFGNGITALYLGFTRYTSATVISMIFSLPNLKELYIEFCNVMPEGPLPTHSVTPQRRSLNSLELHGCCSGIGEALAKSRFTSSRLCLDAHIKGAAQLLLLSSKTVVELELCNTHGDETPPPIHLSSLPALTTLVIDVDPCYPSPHLKNILCSIGSAPMLSSIAIENRDWKTARTPEVELWVDVDRWLSRIARHAEVTGGLPLTLRPWPKGKSVWEGFLPEFRESGGKVKVDGPYV